MYKYEMHLHTCESSRCGRSPGAEHARYYKKLGYDGIVVTDHFFGGNTAASRSGPWENRVEEFCRGYHEAKAEGDRIGLDVFFGWEETFEGDDFLVYGLDEEWLLKHPEVLTFDRRDQFDAVHAAGGCVIQAHPFRCRDYIKKVHLALSAVDGVEVANAGNDQLFDYYARLYAEEYGMLMMAGSDNHKSQEGCPVFGIGLKKKLTCIGDLVDVILKREQPALLVPEERFARPADAVLPLECELIGSTGARHPYHQPWLEAGPFASWLKGE